ncbi:hypothetical protein KUTeg_006160 [Tegillarca granosa]|uniref:Uncharacterized protein n=1 Tax=Tegillarca granosa TaxID=220873 RepID=A0ABQ9FFQ1_TEGGR|nr:hypothetical protein KUTeg_006160 [Tegillarca granosa]
MFVVSVLIAIYYNMIIAYTLYYFFASFTSVLPWSYCGDWKTEACSTESRTLIEKCIASNGTWCNETCVQLDNLTDSYRYQLIPLCSNVTLGCVFYCILSICCTANTVDTRINSRWICYMAEELGIDISEVASEGAGLAFVAYPEVVTKLPISQLWSLLFFSMLITLGLGTQIATVTTVHTTLLDQFPHIFRRGKRGFALLMFIAFTCFVIGLTFCTQGGMYILQLFDNYAATYSLLFIGFVECIALAWVYGADRFLGSSREHTLIKYLSRPSPDWGPALKEHQTQRKKILTYSNKITLKIYGLKALGLIDHSFKNKIKNKKFWIERILLLLTEFFFI